MVLNYLKIAWRNLIKGKLYSAINIVGLAVGIACCLLIGLYVYEELRFDRFHEKADQIYRLNHTSTHESQTSAYASSPPPLVDYLRGGFPEVEQVTSIEKRGGVIRIDNQLFEEEYLIIDPHFFGVFDFPMLHGNPANSLETPEQVLLTASAARHYFGTTDVVGEPVDIRFDTEFYPATVGGVVEDPPQHSSIQFRVLSQWSLWTREDPASRTGLNWGTLRGSRFALVNPQTDLENLEERVNAGLNEHAGESWNVSRFITFQPLTGIHLGEFVQGGMEPTANVSFLYIAVVIGVLVLVIACINFTSLSIGHSVRRAREVGMRKAMGAQRGQLIFQFWGETVLVTLMALVGGLLLTEFLLPYFGSLVNRQLELDLLGNPGLIAMVLGVVLLTGLLAGSYPALYLSKFRPSQVFRSKIFVGGRHSLIRLLTGVQFAVAVILIIGTFFMNQQMGLLLNSNPGYDEEYVIQMDVPMNEGRQIMEGLQARLENEPSVRMISGAWEGLAGAGATFNDSPITADDSEIRGFSFGVEPEMPELLGFELVEGRLFGEAPTSSAGEIIVNQNLVRTMGWENPIGKTMSRRFTFANATVVGVVEDFHFQSMHYDIGPLAIHTGSPVIAIYARVDGNNIQQALARFEQAWQEVAPGIPFDYTFLDQQVEQQYREDQRWASIVELASVIAIVISCMGLFGLATLASLKRAKEIGIRKVLGATVASATATLSKDFLKPVMVGLAVAIPLSYLLMEQWLADFAYRIELGAWTFILASVLTIGIALLTVSWQSVRAATANPVDSLRAE